MSLLTAYCLLLTAAFGAIVGSFLNVLVLRIGTGRGLAGRSACLSCSKQLGFFELVPIFSYLAQGGRCRACKSRISTHYILVEALTALSFAGITWKILTSPSPARGEGWGEVGAFLFLATVAAILIAIIAYDIRHQIIPDSFVFALFAIALVRVAYLYAQGSPVHIQIVSALGITLFLFLLFAFSRGRWLGLGDVKLILPLALFLPWSDNLVALMLAFWSGAVVGLALIGWSHFSGKHRVSGRGGSLGVKERRASHQSYQLKSEIPFAPFLILGTATVYFVHIPLLPF